MSGLGVPGAGAGRAQVPLKPGHSLMDWVRLTKRSGRTLAGTAGKPRPISLEELSAHGNPDKGDVWMALQGKVYNISPYLAFHPGGAAELLRGAGADGTSLFNEYHAWVNGHSMMEACLVGYLEQGATQNSIGAAIVAPQVARLAAPPTFKAPSRARPPAAAAATSSRLAVPTPVLVVSDMDTEADSANAAGESVSFDWLQTGSKVIIVFTATHAFAPDAVTLHVAQDSVQFSVAAGGSLCKLLLGLTHGVDPTSKIVKYKPTTVTLALNKAGQPPKPPPKWKALGTVLSQSVEPLQQQQQPEAPADPSSAAASADATAAGFDHGAYHPITFESVRRLTHDTSLFRFAVPEPDKEHWRIPVGGHVRFKAVVDGAEVVRNYTPVTDPAFVPSAGPEPAPAYIDFLIKVYPQGAMSSHVGSLSPGDTLLCTTALGRFTRDLSAVKAVGMIAAGTGITPMVKVANKLLGLGQAVSCSMLLCNRTEADRPYLGELAGLPAGFSATHLLSEPSNAEYQPRGKISREILQSLMPPPTADCLVLVCGAPGFTTLALSYLGGLGYSADQCHAFT